MNNFEEFKKMESLVSAGGVRGNPSSDGGKREGGKERGKMKEEEGDATEMKEK